MRNGGWYRDRTCDPYHVNVVISLQKIKHPYYSVLCYATITLYDTQLYLDGTQMASILATTGNATPCSKTALVP